MIIADEWIQSMELQTFRSNQTSTVYLNGLPIYEIFSFALANHVLQNGKCVQLGIAFHEGVIKKLVAKYGLSTLMTLEWMAKGSFRLDAAVCGNWSRLRRCIDKNFSISLQQCNCLQHAAYCRPKSSSCEWVLKSIAYHLFIQVTWIMQL